MAVTGSWRFPFLNLLLQVVLHVIRLRSSCVWIDRLALAAKEGNMSRMEVRCMCVMILNMKRVCHSMTGRMEPWEAEPLGPMKSEVSNISFWVSL